MPPAYPVKALADLTWGAGAAAGSLKATFSTFNVVDHDGDVTLPTAFTEGQAVPLVWSHDWDRPVGKGLIRVLPDRAVFEGVFFLETAAGREAYDLVKAMGELQEYSYGYKADEADLGDFDGQRVRYLKKLHVYEVSPVLVGAGIGTGTEAIKSQDDEAKPFPNESACRLADPSAFDRFRRVNGDQEHDGKPIDVVYGHPKAGGSWRIQALRYPTSEWSTAAARAHCASREGTFEAAESATLDVLAGLKEGRRFSTASRSEIAAWHEALGAVHQAIGALLEDTTPPAKEDTLPPLHAVYAEYQRTLARLNGVAL